MSKHSLGLTTAVKWNAAGALLGGAAAVLLRKFDGGWPGSVVVGIVLGSTAWVATSAWMTIASRIAVTLRMVAALAVLFMVPILLRDLSSDLADGYLYGALSAVALGSRFRPRPNDAGPPRAVATALDGGSPKSRSVVWLRAVLFLLGMAIGVPAVVVAVAGVVRAGHPFQMAFIIGSIAIYMAGLRLLVAWVTGEMKEAHD